MRTTLSIALLIVLLVPVARADDTAFGRLFTTPDERNELNRLRQAKAPDSATATLYGFVIKNDGTTMTWLNPGIDDKLGRHLVIHQTRYQRPTVSMQTESGTRVPLKVGDTLDLTTGQVRPLMAPADNTPGAPAGRPALQATQQERRP